MYNYIYCVTAHSYILYVAQIVLQSILWLNQDIFSFALQFTDLIYHTRTLLNKKCMVYSSMENCERIQVQVWALGPPHMHY